MTSASYLSRTTLLVQLDFYPDLTEQQIVDGLGSTRVQITADAETLSSHAGQTAVSSALVMICQLGAWVRLAIPDAPLLGEQPPFEGGSLARALTAGSGGIPGRAEEGWHANPDLFLVFGAAADAGFMPSGDPRWISCIEGDGWGFALEPEKALGAPWGGEAPFGGLLAGVAAGAEAFRAAMTRLGEIHGVEALKEHPLGCPRRTRLDLPPLMLGETPSIGKVDVISSGAITNAVLFTLLRVNGLNGALRIFDDDHVSADNLNRCGLFGKDDIDNPKADVLAAQQTSHLKIEGERLRFEEATLREIGELAPRVLVGVDHIPSRWFVQGLEPAWLGVGGTSHLAAIVSEHVSGEPCAGCLHPRDEDARGPIPTISFVSAVAGILLAYRLLAASRGGQALKPWWITPMAFAEPHALLDLGCSANPACPVGCTASSEARAA
jgi:hypothetical protein